MFSKFKKKLGFDFFSFIKTKKTRKCQWTNVIQICDDL